jgi:uncharacterized protein YggU (UPF0235/DUF167 family)
LKQPSAASASDTPFRLRRDGIDLFVKLTPKAATDAIQGLDIAADGRCRLKARVRAAPEKGKANAALERLVARILDLPVSAVSLTAGASARLKTLQITGDPKILAARLLVMSSD